MTIANHDPANFHPYMFESGDYRQGLSVYAPTTQSYFNLDLRLKQPIPVPLLSDFEGEYRTRFPCLET